MSVDGDYETDQAVYIRSRMDDLQLTDQVTSPESETPPPSYDALYNVYPHKVFDPPYPPLTASVPPRKQNPLTKLCRTIGFDLPSVTGRKSTSTHGRSAGHGKFSSKSSDSYTSLDYSDCYTASIDFNPRSGSSYYDSHCHPASIRDFSSLNRKKNHTTRTDSNLEQDSSSVPHFSQHYLHSHPSHHESDNTYHNGSNYGHHGSNTHHSGNDISHYRDSSHHVVSSHHRDSSHHGHSSYHGDSSHHGNSSYHGHSSHHGDTSHHTDSGYHADSHHGGGGDHHESSGGDNGCSAGGDWGGGGDSGGWEGGDSGGGDCGGGDD